MPVHTLDYINEIYAWDMRYPLCKKIFRNWFPPLCLRLVWIVKIANMTQGFFFSVTRRTQTWCVTTLVSVLPTYCSYWRSESLEHTSIRRVIGCKWRWKPGTVYQYLNAGNMTKVISALKQNLRLFIQIYFTWVIMLLLILSIWKVSLDYLWEYLQFILHIFLRSNERKQYSPRLRDTERKQLSTISVEKT